MRPRGPGLLHTSALGALLSAACAPSTPSTPSSDASLDAGATHDAGAAHDAGATHDAGAPLPPAPRCSEPLRAPALPSGRLRVGDGAVLRDALGRAVLLRGVNLGGRSKLPPFAPFEFEGDEDYRARLDAVLATLEGWGVSVLRAPWAWEALEPERGRYDEAWLARYRTLVARAWAHRMRVVVDLHQDVYARALCGSGFPAWSLGPVTPPPRPSSCRNWFSGYFSTTNEVAQAFERLWTNADGLEEQLTRAWVHVATALRDEPGLAGFEVLNEPGTGARTIDDFVRTTLPAFTERVGAALRGAVPDALIVQGGPANASSASDAATVRPRLEGFVYAPHYYDPLAIFGGRYVGTVATRAMVEGFAERGARWQSPVLLGEFGASYASANGERFLRDVFDALDEARAHGAAWEVSASPVEWNEERLGLLAPDGAERPFARELVRGYPRAVDGALERTRWSATERSLEVRVTNAAGGVSELFVPRRHLGDEPVIELRAEAGGAGGCVTHDAAAQALYVRARGAYTLRVRPR